MPGEPQVLVKMRRAWPWGLVLITDADSREQLPSVMTDAGVVGARTALAVRILHADEGDATAEIWLGDGPSGLLCVYDEPLEVPSGKVCMADAEMEGRSTATVDAGTWRARVYLDHEHHPERVIVALSALLDA